MKIKICLIFFLQLIFSPLIVCAYQLDLPQTGQTTSYTSGDDGDIQAGVSLPQPRFEVNGDGTVTDNLTGLVWLQDADCFGSTDWQGALDAANNLKSGDCGLSDSSVEGEWRLPNIREMRSIFNSEYSSPAISDTVGKGQWREGDPFYNIHYDYDSSAFWSSTTVAHYTGGAWYAGDNGDINWDPKNYSYHRFAWPVKGGIYGTPYNSVIFIAQTGQTTSYAAGDDGDIQAGVPLPQPRFTVNGDGTVTDNLTGLVWLQDAGCLGSENWYGALDAVSNLNSGECGLSDDSEEGDWRLPNTNELNSIVDFRYFYPPVANTLGTSKWSEGDPFYNVLHSEYSGYWSSTTWVSDIDYTWIIYSVYGNDSYLHKSGYWTGVWPVREGEEDDDVCDLNQDGLFDRTDIISFIRGCWIDAATWVCDQNGDGRISVGDILIFAQSCN